MLAPIQSQGFLKAIDCTSVVDLHMNLTTSPRLDADIKGHDPDLRTGPEDSFLAPGDMMKYLGHFASSCLVDIFQ